MIGTSLLDSLERHFTLRCNNCGGVFEMFFASDQQAIVRACPHCGSTDAELDILMKDAWEPLPPELKKKIQEVLRARAQKVNR